MIEERYPETIRLVVEEEGFRLDRYIACKLPLLSRAHVQKLIETGNVALERRKAGAGLRVHLGETITITIPAPEPAHLVPLNTPLDIVYEDRDILVINKPAGMPVHPGPGHAADTLVNAVLAHCPDLAGIKGTMRPGVVHRLDKDTSGLIVFAKNDRAMVYLQQQFKSREVSKEYLVLVRGQLSPSIGVITGPVGRDPAHRQRMAVVATGREARTSYRVLEYMKGYTFLEVRPETGRTHQIRVHLSAAGYPVAGDDLYGGADRLAKRQFIHARALSFRLLSTGESRKFEAELPPDLKEVLGRLSSPGGKVI